MRKEFIQSLIKLATDERVLLLTGDLGYLIIEEFIQRFPKQFFNWEAAMFAAHRKQEVSK